MKRTIKTTQYRMKRTHHRSVTIQTIKDLSLISCLTCYVKAVTSLITRKQKSSSIYFEALCFKINIRTLKERIITRLSHPSFLFGYNLTKTTYSELTLTRQRILQHLKGFLDSSWTEYYNKGHA